MNSNSKNKLSTPPALEAVKKASIIIEDLMFTMQRVKPEQLRQAVATLNNLISSDLTKGHSSVARSYQSEDPNKRFLIGVLPRLLLDKDLFGSNEDIIDFAAAVLKLEMSRSAEKRARHEIIGKIICETDSLDERQLTSLVTALERIVNNKENLARMKEEKRLGSFSWNETIQSLTNNRE